jgi:hypothetical protein
MASAKKPKKAMKKAVAARPKKAARVPEQVVALPAAQ